ncbi:hypothetical protein ACYZTM_09245 [Pseudomonas sp. MDT2-39-1]
MANPNATDEVLVDGQLTIETKDITNAASPLPMTTFITTAMVYSLNRFSPGFYIDCYKDKGLSSERKLTINFPSGEIPRISGYWETLTTKIGNSPYDFEIINYTGTIETMKITPNKHRYNVIEFKILAISRANNEIRELTGRGHVFITDVQLAI